MPDRAISVEREEGTVSDDQRSERMDSLVHDLVGHWPLAGDTDDHSGTGLRCRAVDLDLSAEGPGGGPGTAAEFNGRSSVIEVDPHPSLRFGRGGFSISAWVYTESGGADVLGDLVTCFDGDHRKGFHLTLCTNSGITCTANRQNLHFGIDDGRIDPEWTDCGRPGNAKKITCLVVSSGDLYAGTVETGADERGGLYRYAGGKDWEDLGNPDGCNAIECVEEWNGNLYAGTGRYLCHGSAMGETLNRTPGGRVYRFENDGRWTPCGHPGHEDAVREDDGPLTEYSSGKADDIACLKSFDGDLYAISNHRRGVFRYRGDRDWEYIGPNCRNLTLSVYRGGLSVTPNGAGLPVRRYLGGTEWEDCGVPEGTSQIYSTVIHEGRLYIGTWPDGAVHVYEGSNGWRSLGTVAYEREIMGMAIYNGKVYLGALPMANVYRVDGERFSFIDNLDSSPVPLRRVWSMAVYGGRLFAGTLPSGRVWSVEAGKMATWDRTFPSGWHHVAAVKGTERLELFVDGSRVATSSSFDPEDYDVSSDQPLRIGFGPQEHFKGRLSDVRIYRRALDGLEIRSLSL